MLVLLSLPLCHPWNWYTVEMKKLQELTFLEAEEEPGKVSQVCKEKQQAELVSPSHCTPVVAVGTGSNEFMLKLKVEPQN